jgi:hypothetical protein
LHVEVREKEDLASILHQRCSCNLIVKSSLKRLKNYLDDIRATITFLNASNQCIVAFKSFCLSLKRDIDQNVANKKEERE